MRRLSAIAIGALLAMPGAALAQTPSPSTTPSPYNIPTATTQPSLPLVAALTLPRGQTLGQVLRNGLRVRLIAYRTIGVTIAGSLAPRTAKRLHVRSKDAIPRRYYSFSKPGVYSLRLRVARLVASKLRDAMRAKFNLRTALRGHGGSSSTVTPVVLKR